ncbi:alpha/beta fold hydrolase [Roseomonas sp. CCTCC AB2023176]|uniref:alpha/beta fold hydrolase n=1 Tax=Roseomonas sp. CCTCC AB2023176 TaxID=3342640 RepID=UPI0035DEBFAD
MRLPHARRSAAPAIVSALAAALGAMAVWNILRARAAERRHPPSGRFVEAGGVRFHVVDKAPHDGGSRAPVLMLHGNGSMTTDFSVSGLATMLAAHRRVVLLDMPGFGHSSRPWPNLMGSEAQAHAIAEVIGALRLDRPIVVGHSFGAIVAAALGVHHPDLVRGLVLVSGYYVPTARPDNVPFMVSGIPILGDLLRYTVQPFLSDLTIPLLKRRIFQPQPVPPGFDAAVPDALLRRPKVIRAGGANAMTMTPDTMSLRPRYAELRLPVAILAGSEDRIVDPDTHARALHAVVPDSTLRILQGLGHMLHQFAPDAVLAAVEEVDEPARIAA